MDLTNQTAVPAKLMVSSLDDGPNRFGILVAKATFAWNGGERAELVTEDPYPLYDQDVQTPWGILPSDAVPRRDRVFEVILLGAAYAANGAGATARAVELSVGSTTRRLAVFGDRHWEGSGQMAQVSAPVPFQRLPLTYERTMGGSCPVQFDDHTVLDIEDRLNKLGRGFNAEKLAQDLAAGFKSPAGFPKLDYQRPLPNLEHPDHLIGAWTDTPEPYCWATVPADIGFRMARLLHKFRDTGQPPSRREAVEQAYHRAHPDWILPLPLSGSRVTLAGVAPGKPVTFLLPPLRIVADYVIGGRLGQRDLAPHLLLLLPEERRFYIVYRTAFTMEVRPETERAFRLRLEPGWFQYGDAPATPQPAAAPGS